MSDVVKFLTVVDMGAFSTSGVIMDERALVKALLGR